MGGTSRKMGGGRRVSGRRSPSMGGSSGRSDPSPSSSGDDGLSGLGIGLIIGSTLGDVSGGGNDFSSGGGLSGGAGASGDF